MLPSARMFRPDIEGLRAIAVGLVVLGHAGAPGFAGGYIGVDVFFVLSGFLITDHLLKERAKHGSTSLTGFYARRARRLLPAASLVLLATVAASREWLGPMRASDVAEDGRMAALFVSNLHFANEGTQYLNVTAPPSPLQHYWSLAVEEQFYLVWPLLFMVTAVVLPRVPLAWKLAGVLGAVIAGSFAWSVLQTGSDPVWAYFSPLTRAWELGVGALLAVVAGRLRSLPGGFAAALGWSGLAAAVAPAMLYDSATAFPGSAAALPVLGTAAVVAAGASFPRFGPEVALRFSPFQFVGKLSYSLYLWHWPVLIIAEQRAGEAPSGAERSALVALAFGLAAATHYVVENPVRYSRILVSRPVPSVAFGAGLVAVGFLFSGWHVVRLPADLGPAPAGALVTLSDPEITFDPGEPGATAQPTRSPEEAIRLAVTAAEGLEELPESVAATLPHAEWDFAWIIDDDARCVSDRDVAEIVPGCDFGDVEAATNVVLLGDSHVAQWLSAFDQLGKENGWRVTLLSKTGCPVPTMKFGEAFPAGPRVLVREYTECFEWLDRAIAKVNETQPHLLVLSNCSGCGFMVNLDGSTLTRETWGEGLRTTLDRIELAPERIVLVADTPRLPGVLDCLAGGGNPQKCAKPATEALGATYNDAERAVAAEFGVRYVDVSPWFCRETCPPVINGLVAYTNDYHITGSFGRMLAPLLEPWIADAPGTAEPGAEGGSRTHTGVEPNGF